LRTGPGRRRFTPAEDIEIAEKYSAGASLSVLAKEYGSTQTPISRAVIRAGGSLRKQGSQHRSFTPEQILDMKQMWESGASQHAIGQKYKAHQTVISNVLAFHGIRVDRRQSRGEKHGSWKGGVSIDSQGYASEILPPDSPFAEMRNVSGRVMQHRLVMARSLGRPLLPTETVHHINGDRLDNRLSNLELRQGKHGKHAVFCCADCGSRNVVPVGLKSELC
jgi:HNH endonuclease